MAANPDATLPPIGANKAIAAGTAGAASIVVIWLIGIFGVAVPPEVVSAATTLVATLFTYLVPHGGLNAP